MKFKTLMLFSPTVDTTGVYKGSCAYPCIWTLFTVEFRVCSALNFVMVTLPALRHQAGQRLRLAIFNFVENKKKPLPRFIRSEC